MRYFVRINDDKSNDFFVVTTDDVPVDVSSIALEISIEDHDKFFSDNGKYRFVKSDSATPIAVLDEIITTVEDILATAITKLNNAALTEIKMKETYYIACLTSSLYTDDEMKSILAQTKADKLAIITKLQAAQGVLING